MAVAVVALGIALVHLAQPAAVEVTTIQLPVVTHRKDIQVVKMGITRITDTQPAVVVELVQLA
jgi:hypothetical protein